jgi:hypothetical protein
MLDASIPLRVKPVEIENPTNAFARVQQIDLMGQQNALAQMAMQEKRRAIEEDTALNQAYAGAINETGEIDRPKLFSSMAQNKLGSKIPATQKIFNDQDKSKLEAVKLKIETTHKIINGISSLMNGATDQRSYDEAKAEGARLYGPEYVAQLPAQYDQKDIARRQEQTLTFSEKLVNDWKKVDNLFKIDEFNYKKTNDETNRNVTIRGQDMTDARSKRANDLKERELDMGGKPPPGYRWTPDGSLTAIPGGPGDKLSEGQNRQVIGVQNLSNAIAEYRSALKSFPTTGVISPDQRARMGTYYNNMMLQAKEAYQLGVLNGPDLDILTSVITDPRSMKGFITSKAALDEQAGNLDQIMQKIGENTSVARPRMSPSSSPPASSGFGVPPDIDQLLNKHGGSKNSGRKP